MKNRFIALVLIAMLALALFAGAGSAIAEETHKPVTLQVQMSESEWQEGFDKVKENFEAEYPWITIEDVGDGQTQLEFISSCIASGDIPPIIQVTSQQIYQDIVNAGLMMNLADFECIKNTPEYYVNRYTLNGTVYGAAQGTAFSVVYVNMAALREAGWEQAPANWDEFIQCCKDIADKTDYAPIAVDAKEPTLCHMLFELVLGSTFDSAEDGAAYEAAVLNGTYDYTANAELAEKLNTLIPYMMPGCSQTGMDDLPALMADGTIAMAVEGNWRSTAILSAIAQRTGDSSDAVAFLAPFCDDAATKWIDASPETGYGIVLQDDEDLNEAARLFLEWLYMPEHFAYMQAARGTVPVLTNMDESLIVLEEGIKGIVSEVSKANAILMSFNILDQVANDAMTVALQDAYSGNMSVEDALDVMTRAIQANHLEG